MLDRMALPEHRASDAEREATAERLRVAAGDGRLDPDELEERLEAAYGARTVGELEAVTRDLPAHAGPGAKPERAWATPEVRSKLATFIVVNTICVVIWLASGAEGHFWPIWVILGTGIGLFATLVRRALGVEEHEQPSTLPRPRP
jgi:DUF1707 SHOCT-like domain/2TM domain